MPSRDFSSDETTYLDFQKKLTETELANLYLLDDGDKLWIPKSVIQCEDEGTLGVHAWWARKQGID